MQTLKEVPVGKSVSVVKLHGTGAVKRRIMDMGITKGTEVYVRKVAPLGDPVEVTVRGYELSLRKEDANKEVWQFLLSDLLNYKNNILFYNNNNDLSNRPFCLKNPRLNISSG